MRRILALVLSVAMVLMLPVFAFADGSQIPYSNGVSETTAIAADGTKTSVTTVDGDIESVDVEVSEAAAEGEEVVELPTTVAAVQDPEDAVEISITVPAGETAAVEIPVSNNSAKAVVMVKNADGTYSVVKKTALTEDGLVLEAEGEATYVVVENDKEFTDVTATWQQEAADFVSARELMLGTGADTFNPTKEVSADMMMTVLARLDDGVTTEASTGSNWAAAGESWAQSEGLAVSGTLTRADMVVMLYKYAGSPAADTSVLAKYVDTEGLTAEQLAAFAWCVENGIIGGTSAENLSPAGTANRGTLAVIIMRYVNTIVG